MVTTAVLQHQLATKGNKLLRLVVHGFYDPADIVIAFALTDLSPSLQGVMDKDLAKALTLPVDYINNRLTALAKDYLLVSRPVTKITWDIRIRCLGKVYDDQEARDFLLDLWNVERIAANFAGTPYYTQEEIQAKSTQYLAENLFIYPGIPHSRGLQFDCASPTQPGAPRVSVHLQNKEESSLRWHVDVNLLVNSVRYKILQIKTYYDHLIKSPKFFCGNTSCPHHTDPLDQSQLSLAVANQRVGAGGMRTAFHHPGLPGTFTQGMPLLPPIKQQQPIQQQRQMKPDIAVKPDVAIKQDDEDTFGGLKRHFKPETPSMFAPNTASSSNSAQSQGPQFTCPSCREMLYQRGGPSFRPKLRLFLAQTHILATLSHECFLLLKQLYSYHAQQGDKGHNDASGNGSNKNDKRGVGARGGCSTAADLASRKESYKDPIPWDEMSSSDLFRLEIEKNKEAHMQAEERFQRELQKRNEERARQHAQLVKNEQIERTKVALREFIFGPPKAQKQGEEENDKKNKTAEEPAPPPQQQQPDDNSATHSSNKPEASPVKQDTAVISFPNLAQFIVAQPPPQPDPIPASAGGKESTSNLSDPNTIFISVHGQSKPFDQITEADLDAMTHTEFQAYTEAMKMS